MSGAGSTFAEWAVDDMTGSLRPVENDVEEWRANSLHAVLDASSDAWLLDLYFYGNDAESGATGPVDHYEEHVTTDTLLAPVAVPAS